MNCLKCKAGALDLRLEPIGKVVHPMPTYRSPVRTSPGLRVSCLRCRCWTTYGYMDEDNFIEVSEGAVCETAQVLPRRTRRDSQGQFRGKRP